MRKLFFTALISHLFFCLQAQQLDSLGMDANPALNSAEMAFLNEKFSRRLDKFDFTNKKIAFVSGSTGRKLITKQAFFTEVKARGGNPALIQSALFILSENEKKESGGYDGWVALGIKFPPDTHKKRIINELRASQ